jgi:hypothetical protein
VSLVGGRNCPRPDRSSQTEVLQLLSREPDRGNRSSASVVGAGKQPRPRGHKGELAAKSATGSLSSVDLWPQNQLRGNSGITTPNDDVTVGA